MSIESHIKALEKQHRMLDDTIKKMESAHVDDFAVRAAKKNKLHIKEELVKLQKDASRSTN